MSHQSVPCQREGCSTEFTVEDGQESARCPSCGKEHSAPWDQYDAPTDATTDAGEAGPSRDVRVDTDGVRVTITIDVRPIAGGGDP